MQATGDRSAPQALGTVLISGGSSGLGAAVAQAVLEAGGKPFVLDRQVPESGLDYELIDLAHPLDAEKIAREVAEDLNARAVVTAAATDTPMDFAELPGHIWNEILTVNLLGTAAVIRGALPSIRRNGGRVVTISSTCGLHALPAATAYSASKFGVVGFTRALQQELAGEVGVTMIYPGGMRTHFFDGRPEEYKPAPDQMLCEPRDVAESVLFALTRPRGVEVRELLVTPSIEPSWP
jgi:NAD(P)-dependent dehydrogenase (short-subunit alcohol dehydrogenase family)